ncbi:hypothetical protein AX14_012771 [Amanita brunnescens Koide BX004]|nr:hypothetical protein AX14_012771 [Amanita brunnescens Koide BX004]
MSMSDGDDYVRRLAAFIRAHEAKFALSPILRPKGTPSWRPFQYHNPAVLSLDFYRLNYILIRLEAHGFTVGPLDVHVNIPSHPISHLGLQPSPDRSDALSLASFKSSISAITSLSLPNYWWNTPGPDSIDRDLKYIYSCFTKLPAVSLKAPRPSTMQGLTIDPTGPNALPLHVFKNIQSLECADIDPRIFLGWNRLAECLRSLKICRSGIDDFTEIFAGAALESEPHPGHVRSGEQIGQKLDFDHAPEGNCIPALAGNSLKGRNFLLRIPRSFGPLVQSSSLYSTWLEQIRTLNLSKNRLESICGLERLSALQCIDLRHNHIQESAEVGRLSMVPDIAEVWVDGNPFVKREVEHRLNCLGFFWREGKTIRLDGALPNFYEEKGLALQTKKHTTPSRLASSSSPIVVTQPDNVAQVSSFDSQIGPPSLRDGGSKKKKIKRLVHLHAQSANRGMEALPGSLETDRAYHPSNPSLRSHRRFHTEILLTQPSDVTELDYRDDTSLVQRQGSHDIYPDNVEGGEVLRRRIEALRKDMGEGWLKSPY